MSALDFFTARKKPKPPTSKSYFALKAGTGDPLSVAKLKLFSYVASLLQPFLTMYENNAPMIPFLFDDLERMYRNLLELIVDSSVLMKCKAGEIVLIY